MKEGWGRARRVRTLAPEAQESEFESPEHTYKKIILVAQRSIISVFLWGDGRWRQIPRSLWAS